MLSDIVEESFQDGLSNDAVHSKFSTPKETTYHQDLIEDTKDEQPTKKTDEVTSTFNSLNKQYTKHCTEECTKQDCAHTIRFSESYERILKIISNYNTKLKGEANNDLEEENEDDDLNDDDENGDVEEDDEADEEDELELNEQSQLDFKDELKQRYSSSNQNIYKLNEFFKEELTRSLDPTLNNEQYVYRSLSEANLNYSLDQPEHRSQSKNESGGQRDHLRNRTFSSDAINNQLRSIEKDLGIENIENVPIKPGIDGQHVRTFDELLNRQLNEHHNFSSMFITPENPTKRPYLRKGAGLKRFQGRSIEPRGKLCRMRNQKLKQIKQQYDNKKLLKKQVDSNRKIPDPKRIDYLAQPKCVISRDAGSAAIDLENENDLKLLNQSKQDIINRDYMTSNLSDKFKDTNSAKRTKAKSKITNIQVNKVDKEVMMKDKESKNRKDNLDGEQAKKARVQLVSKISVNKSYQQDRQTSDLVQSEWDKKVR